MADPDSHHPIEIVERGVRPSMTRRAIGLIALLALALAVWVATDRQTILSWRDDAGPIPFFIALAILPAIGFPTTPFFVLAGALYGTGIGLFGSALAVSANLILCYWISHSGLRPWIKRRLSRTKYKLPNFAESRAGAVRFTLLIKVAPGLPTFAKNYVIGLTGVPFWTYFVVSFVFTGIYGASFIVLGESIFARDFGTAGIAAGVLAAGGGVLVWFRLKRARRLRSIDRENPSDEMLSSPSLENAGQQYEK